jgi:hypothetical protein
MRVTPQFLHKPTLALAAFAFVSCGGSSTPTTPSITSITVNASSDVLLMGKTETFTAVASAGALSNPRWGSDNTGVATVDAGTGLVTVVGLGAATIFVDSSGARGTKRIRTLPDFGGGWTGSYILRSCQATGDFELAGFCDVFSPGTALPMQLQLTQSRDIVTGSFAFGLLIGSVTTGTVSGSTLSLTGVTTDAAFPVQLQNGHFDSAASGVISGSFEQFWSFGVSALTGTGRTTTEILSMTRSTAGVSPLSTKRRIATLSDLIAAVSR